MAPQTRPVKEKATYAQVAAKSAPRGEARTASAGLTAVTSCKTRASAAAEAAKDAKKTSVTHQMSAANQDIPKGKHAPEILDGLPHVC